MGKFIDLTGKNFNDWKVIDYAGKGYWNCECSCGEIRKVLGKTLRSGASKSCGHNTNNLKDMTGMVINEWRVIDYAGDGKWNCECSCGNKSTVHGYDLRNNKSIDCGHGRKKSIAIRNSKGRIKLEGKTINEWEVLEYIGDNHYKCKCSCGKIKDVASRDLTAGISKSCGHNNGKQNIIDITGMHFGELEVVRYLGYRRWECKCSCGKITEVLAGNLKNGSVKSCGCKQYSRIDKEEFIDVINKFIRENGEKPYIKDLSVILNRHPGNINRYINNYNLRHYINAEFRSRAERDIFNMFGIDGIINDRQVLNGMELDIYYPDLNMAIEFNGDYWHSKEYKDKYYHQMKTIECAKKKIQLIHIFEHEWEDIIKREKIIKLIERKILNNTKIIHARNTEIVYVDTDEVKEFLNENHIQNYSPSSINIGCRYDGELVGVMTFGKPRFNKNYQYELIRLAWKSGIAVNGGAERMFKRFIRDNSPKSIITYCDISKFTGNVYSRLGFKADKNCITKPNYVWVKPLGNIVLKRYQTMKHKLIEDGLGNENQTEDEIMENLGFLKIYDSGNLRLSWHNKQ